VTKHFKVPRVRTSAFVRGAGLQTVVLKFLPEQVALLETLVASANEMYVDDALMAILLAVSTNPPSQLLVETQQHRTLLGEFAKQIDSIYKRKLNEAETEAANSITQHLIERGIIE
jgi:hypothetical protein